MLAAAFGAPRVAHAVEGGGQVTGTITLADPQKRGEAPAKSQGFVPRARNALKAPRAFDPLPYVVVVLEGTAATEDTQPPNLPVQLTIIGESFDHRVLPVVKGSVVEIKNGGRNSPRLYSPTAPDLLPGDPVSPKGERKTRALDQANQVFEIRDRESAHLSGKILVLPHRYFATVDKGGKYKIEDVAPGTYKVRAFYNDGFVDMPAQTIEVAGKRETKVGPIALPGRIKTKPLTPSATE